MCIYLLLTEQKYAGCFLLDTLAKKYNRKNISLYRDDGLTVFKNISGPESERIKKDFQKTFKNHVLDIIIQCNMKIVNYLDLTLNLTDSTYSRYRKQRDTLCAQRIKPPSKYYKTNLIIHRDTFIKSIIK